MEDMEKPPESKWFIGFRVTHTNGVKANQLMNDDVSKNILAAAMDGTKGVNIVFGIPELDSERAIGAAAAMLWNIFDYTGLRGLVEVVQISSGAIVADCTERYFELEQSRANFYNTDS